MPYHIIQVPGGFKVANAITGREFSIHPLTLNQAKSQMKYLYIHADQKSGGDLAGRFNYVVDNNSSRTLNNAIKHFGFFKITAFAIHRTPVQSIFTHLLNITSLGKFKKEIDRKGYDKLFHLFVVFQLQYDNFITYVLTEKTPNIMIETRKGLTSPHTLPENLVFKTLTTPFTFSEMYERAINAQGEKFFQYDPYNNNCQVYIKSIINALNITEFDDFIYQPLDSVLEGFTRKLATDVTNLGHFVGRVKGAGDGEY